MGQLLEFWLGLWSLLLKVEAVQAKKTLPTAREERRLSAEGEEGGGGWGCIGTSWTLLIY